MTNRKTWLLLALVLFIAPAVGEEEAKSASAVNAFGFDLYGELREKPGNLFLSPYSIHVALTMTGEGAEANTRAQMADVLHLCGRKSAEEHADLAAGLQAPSVRDGYGRDAKMVKAYELSTANAVWVQEGLGLLEPFVGKLTQSYQAPPRPIDFMDPDRAREIINAWAAKETKDRIPNLLPDHLPTRATSMVLANAIYFKGTWSRPFEARWTKEAVFHADGQREVKVPMMHRSGGYRYGTTEDAQVLEIPYRGGHARMLIVLPKARDGLPALEEGLSGDSLAGWLGSLDRAQVSVKLPRFTFTSSFELAPTLAGMGMEDAFDARKADFTGITAEDALFISAVIHKAFVKLDESGTEAAAATAVVMDRGGPPPDPVEFVADHPFLFLIRHEATGCILFLGRVVNPSGK